jgi:hypothetical protein
VACRPMSHVLRGEGANLHEHVSRDGRAYVAPTVTQSTWTSARASNAICRAPAVPSTRAPVRRCGTLSCRRNFIRPNHAQLTNPARNTRYGAMTLVDSVIVHSLGSVSAIDTSGPILRPR